MADTYRVLLTEDGYTTAGGPFDRDIALADFDRYAGYCKPLSGSSLRVVTEAEYQRIWPELDRRNQEDVATAPKPDDDHQTCVGCGDRVYTLSSQGFCDGCVEDGTSAAAPNPGGEGR